ncbi:MAG: hypothetical protein Q4E07_00505 [Eubacteriales bacterium]|nr:hypothetical protein [Eubacteriales bacterium]
MIERFLNYSLRYGKKIKAIWLENDEIKQANITVKEIQGDTIFYSTAKLKTPATIQKQQLLSLGYSRGDSGELELFNKENQ